MKFSILINTHNQQKYLNKAITSCLRQSFKDYEIIIFDSSDKKNNNPILKKSKNKKIQYFHIKSKFKQPEKNQMNKILLGLKKSKGKFICLMDGDDYFAINKINMINKLIQKKEILFNQDNPILIKNKLIVKKRINTKFYKNNFLFRILFNDWPQVYGTSSIIVNRKILKDFFKKVKPFNWKYLAIDIQLILFCFVQYSISNFKKEITYKNIHQNNLGDKYLNIFTKIFWERRFMQHKYYSSLTKKVNFNLDFILTSFIYFFLRFL